jgi:hypothetical protein
MKNFVSTIHPMSNVTIYLEEGQFPYTDNLTLDCANFHIENTDYLAQEARLLKFYSENDEPPKAFEDYNLVASGVTKDGVCWDLYCDE